MSRWENILQLAKYFSQRWTHTYDTHTHTKVLPLIIILTTRCCLLCRDYLLHLVRETVTPPQPHLMAFTSFVFAKTEKTPTSAKKNKKQKHTKANKLKMKGLNLLDNFCSESSFGLNIPLYLVQCNVAAALNAWGSACILCLQLLRDLHHKAKWYLTTLIWQQGLCLIEKDLIFRPVLELTFCIAVEHKVCCMNYSYYCPCLYWTYVQ